MLSQKNHAISIYYNLAFLHVLIIAADFKIAAMSLGWTGHGCRGVCQLCCGGRGVGCSGWRAASAMQVPADREPAWALGLLGSLVYLGQARYALLSATASPSGGG